jgi:hypothetical protein
MIKPSSDGLIDIKKPPHVSVIEYLMNGKFELYVSFK